MACEVPPGRFFSHCGCYVRSCGSAGFHYNLALVLLTRGRASGIEITRLANEIRKSVFMKFGMWIEPEVYVI